MSQHIAQGDFSTLAKHYSNRAGYSPVALSALTRYVGLNTDSIIADVGAGTGKWTEQLATLAVKSIFAVEPNEPMRLEGAKAVTDSKVTWQAGSGEATNLPDGMANWVTMASSFHWVNTEKGLNEFHRILKPGGYFTALWNPRDITANPLHEQIEKKIYEIAPHIKRVSSGTSAFTEKLFESLVSTKQFTDVIYMEARHVEVMTKERYMGIWHSVNDIQSQAGPEKWQEILAAIEAIIAPLSEIRVPYKTKAWTVQRIG